MINNRLNAVNEWDDEWDDEEEVVDDFRNSDI